MNDIRDDMRECDGKRVGVIATTVNGFLVVPALVDQPMWRTFLTGHFDGATCENDALAALLLRYFGDTTTAELATCLIGETWTADRCARPVYVPANTDPGHYWYLHDVVVPYRYGTGEFTGHKRWESPFLTKEDVTGLAIRTVVYAMGGITDDDLMTFPALDPVWCLLLHEQGWYHLSDDVLNTVAAIASMPTGNETRQELEDWR